jgi:uncharacterized protein YegJ (DUF2314 family)
MPSPHAARFPRRRRSRDVAIAPPSPGGEGRGEGEQVFEKRERGESDFALKVKITNKKGTEHFGATDIERRDGKTMGTINSDPNIVASVTLGDRLEIPEADISDSLYMRDGKMVGTTLKPLFKTRLAAEVAPLKKVMAGP